MSKERYVEHTVALELPIRDSVTKGNYNLADIETKYLPIQTEVVSDNKDKTITDLEAKLAESEEQLKEELVEKKGLERALSACNRQNDEFAEMIKKLVSEKEELKQQLAEKEKRCEICGSKMILGELGYYCSNTELHNIYPAPNEAKPDYEEITLLKQDYDAMVEREELLRQQLAEKEKEIEYQESMKILAVENQNKKAIEQLEKVKELLNTDFESTISWIDPYEDGEYVNSMTYNHNNIIKIIDNQIKQLKKIKKEGIVNG